MSRAWITTLDDGRTNYKFHQSWLADTDLCLERARAGLVGELRDAPTDATATGTGMHAGIEHALTCLRDLGELCSFEDAHDVAQAAFTYETSIDGFGWKKRKERGARNYITTALELWWDQVSWKLDPWHIELPFGPYTLYEDDQRRIQLGGTMDYVDRRWGLMDWKTGSPHSWEGKDWEKARWAIQPTVYSWAWFQWCAENNVEVEIPISFRFVAMLDNKTVQKIQVFRRPEDWVWLERKVLAVVRQIEMAGVDGPWPLNDQHALCSDKWCPKFGECKGSAVHVDWPRSASHAS